MATRITVQVWKGPKQVFGEPDRITAAAVTRMHELHFTQNGTTGRWQIKCGAGYVERELERVMLTPGVVVVDEAPEGDPLTWRDRPVSTAQRALLDKLGIVIPVDANRGMASDLISSVINGEE